MWSESRSVESDSLRPVDYTVRGILQARLLEWVAFPFSRGSSQPRDWTGFSCVAGGFFTNWATREAQGGVESIAKRQSLQIQTSSTNNKCRKGCGGKGALLHCWRECKLVQPLWRAAWRFLKKLKIELLYDPEIPLLGICIWWKISRNLIHIILWVNTYNVIFIKLKQ